MHPRTASGTTGDSHGSSSHGLKHSRSFLTLADLPDASDGAHNLHPPVGDMDIQSNGPQQVTLVQGNQTTRGGLLAKKEASAVSNPFIDVLQGKVKTQVVSLTAPSAAAEARQGGVYTTATAGAAAAAKAYSPRSERRRLKKRQAAYLSLVVVALALLFRKDEGTSRINKELGSFGQQPIAWSHPTQVATSVVSSVIEAYFDRPAAGGAGSGDGEVSAWVMDRWNATRHEAAPLLTEWGESLSPSDVTSKDHHPRPQMQRPSDTWINLNGFWDFKIEPFTNGASVPTSRGFRREKILVPFAIESALSGVGEGVGEGEQLVYRRVFRVEAGALAGGQRCVLHFGALDWKAWVYFNGELLGVNEGGYAPFEFDVTDYLVPDHRQEHELMVVVWDPTEDGHAPHGKQWRNKGSDRLIAPAGMWYTSVTGIWQTVYMEFVPPIHVERMEMVPRISDRSLDLRVDIVSTSGLMPYVKVSAHTDEHGVVGQGSGWGEEITMNFQEEHMPRLWTPDTPFLYNLTVSLHHSADGPAIDQVESYFAMREISLGRVGESVQFFLNGAPLFQYGVLDQGYWPDGLYTAPSDEALRWDILKAKELGFNMIRKHAKVESSRWYHHADKIGMLVWQDMPSASALPYLWSPDGAHDFLEGDQEPRAASSFVSELSGVMSHLQSHPSIVGWIPFNEGWGQFGTADIFKWMERRDPTRPIWVSGGNDFGIGQAFDRHVYPGPAHVRLESCRASVLGEFGGNGHPVPGHQWGKEEGGYESFTSWGYSSSSTSAELKQTYARQMGVLADLAEGGLAAAVFTQLTDVESESNGLITYDRKITKIDPSAVRHLHERLYKPRTGPVGPLSSSCFV